YLARVCADTPTTLRRCQPGESGVVVSRYHHVGGRDWIAVPLIPYLYAVKDAASIPLFADAKLVEFLRHNYLQENMSEEARDMGPRASSNQLAGSAYDRTTYGFRFATGPDQDDELIRILNSEPNSEAYALLNRNCADFAKQILNFYYPHAAHRSIIADVGVTTLKRDVRQDGVPGWREFQASAKPEIDGEGQTFLRGDVNGETVRIGICRDNSLRMNAPPEIVQDLVLTRLEQELKPKPARASKRQVEQDLSLLQRALEERNAELSH